MKNYLPKLKLHLIICSFSISLAAQEPAHPGILKELSNPSKNLSRLFNSLSLALEASPIPENYVPERVKKVWYGKMPASKMYKPSWMQVDNRNFLITATSVGVQTKMSVTKKGALNSLVHYGTEQQLPTEERRLLRSFYVDYTIGAVCEVYVMRKHIWIVNLEGQDNFITARLEQGQLEEIGKINKQKLSSN